MLQLSGTDVLECKYLRFRIASDNESGVLQLRDILNIQYSTAITRSYLYDMWHLDCATDPQINDKDESQILNWLADVIAFANDHSCNFVGWSLVDAHSGEEFSTFAFT